MLQANPDGRKEAEAGLSWRKNTNENYCGVTSTSRGADLNRNFAFHWGCCGGSSGSPVRRDLPRPVGRLRAGDPGRADLHGRHLPRPARAGSTSTRHRPTPRASTSTSTATASWCCGPGAAPARPRPTRRSCRRWAASCAYFNGYTPQKSVRRCTPPTARPTISLRRPRRGAPTASRWAPPSSRAAPPSTTPSTRPTCRRCIYAAKVVRTPYLTPLGPDALSLALSTDCGAGGQPGDADRHHQRHALPATAPAQPTQAIAAAEYYIDTPPWAGGRGRPSRWRRRTAASTPRSRTSPRP